MNGARELLGALRWSRGLRRAGVLAKRSVSEFFEDRAPLIAAAISYYALFSLFPLAIVLVAVLGLVLDEQRARQEVIDLIIANLPLRPGEGRRELAELLRSVTSRSAGFGAVGVVGLVFAASGLIGVVRRGIDSAWEAEQARPPLQGKALDLLLVAGVGVVVAGSLALTLIARLVGSFEQAVPLLVNAAVFLFLFRVLPARETSVRDVWPGVLVATLGYEGAKTGFSLYLENFANYGAVYGSLGVAVAFLVFVFAAANVFLLGAEAASVWPLVRDERLENAGGPPLRKRAADFLKRLVVRRD